MGGSFSLVARQVGGLSDLRHRLYRQGLGLLREVVARQSETNSPPRGLLVQLVDLFHFLTAPARAPLVEI